MRLSLIYLRSLDQLQHLQDWLVCSRFSLLQAWRSLLRGNYSIAQISVHTKQHQETSYRVTDFSPVVEEIQPIREGLHFFGQTTRPRSVLLYILLQTLDIAYMKKERSV